MASVAMLGVVSVGVVPNTTAPDPVSSLTAPAKLADDGVARKVATPLPRPSIPVDTGRPVALVRVRAEGVPKLGVVSVGLVANTAAPVPVSSVSAALRLSELGVAKNVPTLEPRPVMPVETGNPVQLVSVPLAGVPRAGAVMVALLIVGAVRVAVVSVLPSMVVGSLASATVPEVRLLALSAPMSALVCAWLRSS